ncbi:NAD-binding protein [Thiotrichales bacterium 19S9-12]|nr:NAD-binding protein [Thiotrichales bacterium 19S9-11]MCF6811783.1 NAD-binding protein [Thiotrichales bacterium 19S9-12]
MSIVNWFREHHVKTHYIPLFFACLLVLNGLLSIFVGVYPYFKDALNAEHSEFISKFLLVSTSLKVNTIVLIIFGYLLLLTGRGIFRRQRFFWYLAIVMLSILFANNAVIGAFDSPLTWFYFIEVITLLLCYRVFDERSRAIQITYSQFIILISFVFALLYGIVGSYILRDEFNNLKTLTDATYFTIVTFSTVGYGDITPITYNAKLFVISMIFIGLGAFATILTYVVGAFVSRVQDLFNSLNKGKKYMKNHVIICGYNNLTQIIIKRYQKDETPYLIIEDKANDDPLLQELDGHLMRGNASDEAILDRANILKARSIILAYEKDAENILALLTVSEVFKDHNLSDIKIIIRVNQKANISKAKSLGAQHIISPMVMAADKIMEQAV